MDTERGYLLVVEDIPDILTLLHATLSFKGYRVVTARNGQEALDAIQRERPALVIADILMPKMDGFGLVHRLRINPLRSGVRQDLAQVPRRPAGLRRSLRARGVTRFIE